MTKCFHDKASIKYFELMKYILFKYIYSNKKVFFYVTNYIVNLSVIVAKKERYFFNINKSKKGTKFNDKGKTTLSVNYFEN